MRYAAFFATISVCIAICIASTPLILAQSTSEQVKSDVAFADGLETVSFDTLEGRVEVDLPDDVSASDTISGTVIAEPKGETREEFVENSDELRGYVVEIAKTQEVKEPPELVKEEEKPELPDKPLKIGSVPKPTIDKKPPEIKLDDKENSFTCQVPASATKFTIILKKPDGQEVCRRDIKSAPAKPKPLINASHPPKCQFPPSGTCGKAISIPGTCDGRSATSRVKINNRKCRVLAESPRRQIVRAPEEGAGKCNIESSECGFVRRGVIMMKPAVASAASIPRSNTTSSSTQRKTDLSGKWEATCTDHGIAVTTDGVTQNHPGIGQMPASIVELTQQGNQLTWSYPGQIERTSETRNLVVDHFTGTLTGNTADLHWRNAVGKSKYDYVMTLHYNPTADTIDAEGVFHTTVWNGYSISRSSCKLRRAGASSRPVAPPPRPTMTPKSGAWILQSVTPRFRWSKLDYKHLTVHTEPRPNYLSNPAATTLTFTEPPQRIRQGERLSLRVTLIPHGSGFPSIGQASWTAFGLTKSGSYGSGTQRNTAATLPERPHNVAQFVADYDPPIYISGISYDARIILSWVGNSTNEDITWKYKWVLDQNSADAPSTLSSAPPPTNRFEPAAPPPARPAPNTVPPQQLEDRKISYAKGAQLRSLHDIRQLEYDRVIAVMLGNSSADSNQRAETLRKNNDASANDLRAAMVRLDEELQSSGRTVGYVNYAEVVNGWNRTKELNDVGPQLQAQLDAERQQKMHELLAVERRNPQLAMQMATKWRDGLVTWMKSQLDLLEAHWADADRSIQNACSDVASAKRIDYVSFNPISGAVDLTNEVLSSLQARSR